MFRFAAKPKLKKGGKLRVERFFERSLTWQMRYNLALFCMDALFLTSNSMFIRWHFSYELSYGNSVTLVQLQFWWTSSKKSLNNLWIPLNFEKPPNFSLKELGEPLNFLWPQFSIWRKSLHFCYLSKKSSF